MDRKPGHLTKDVTNAVSSLIWVKMVGVGNAGVGKTSLVKHFCESKFVSGYQPTVGVDYGFKIQNVNGAEVRVHLWDLSGSTDYVDVRNELYGLTDAIFLMFDVHNQSSFDSLETWLREIRSFASGNPEIYLIGNKIDVKQNRVISVTEAKKFASQHRFKYYETSAATGEGITKMMNDFLSSVLARRKPQYPISLSGESAQVNSVIDTNMYRQKSAKRK
ncbi:dnaJ homolog subfamily C member 27 [Patella vulgata]|uniref:dnaJ homolog subfamily C member 27 n=1 Tax=Patella vulgata TaxID=6465 RepID=UPI0021807013|nr:dnaJ homolog subfamily C member 27 [Patella vulgata]